MRGGLNKFYNNFKRELVRALPKSLRFQVIRRGLELEYSLPAELKIQIADTHALIADSFSLVQRTYVDAQFAKTNTTGMRITKFHALPTTIIIVALWKEKVVGTLTVVQDSPLGLPMESVFDLSKFRNQGSRLAEISSLAIDPNFRKSGRILFPLIKYLIEYTIHHLRLDYFFATVNPAHTDFYEAIQLMERLNEKPLQGYSFANNQPAVAEVYDLKSVPGRLKKCYENFPITQNLYRYHFESSFSNLKFPEIKYSQSWNTIFPERSFNYFFKETSEIIEKLSEEERLVLTSYYPNYRELGLISKFQEIRLVPRKETRIPMASQAYLKRGDYQHCVLVDQISKKGFRVRSREDLELNTVYTCTVFLNKKYFIKVAAKLRWKSSNGLYGFCLDSDDSEWNCSVAELEKNYRTSLIIDLD